MNFAYCSTLLLIATPSGLGSSTLTLFLFLVILCLYLYFLFYSQNLLTLLLWIPENIAALILKSDEYEASVNLT